MLGQIEVAKKLQSFRQRAGLSVQQVGDAIGRSPKTVSSWETGRSSPSPDIFIKLCNIYGVEFSDFYPDNGGVTLSNREYRLVRGFRALSDDDADEMLRLIEHFAAKSVIEYGS